jgi:O-acetyl-ADP-ribose deacetylase (regulator of RNase III)
LIRRPEKSIGIATGNIGKIGGSDVLTNSENNFLEMDRPTGKTISGAINAFSADWDEHDRLVRQTVKDELDAIARQVDIPVKLGSAFVTSPGNLASNTVRYVVHTVSVERHRDEFITGTRIQLERCVTNALLMVDGLTRDRCPDAPLRRIVLPLLGTGAGGLPDSEIVPLIIERAVDYLETTEDTALETIYFLAYGPPALETLRAALDNCPDLDTPHDPT